MSVKIVPVYPIISVRSPAERVKIYIERKGGEATSFIKRTLLKDL